MESKPDPCRKAVGCGLAGPRAGDHVTPARADAKTASPTRPPSPCATLTLVMARKPWTTRDPLYRGDAAAGPAVPDPTSRTSLVAHVLYLGGPGRSTPFTSTTESVEVAEYFAGQTGQVWQTDVPTATTAGAEHLPRKQLLENLRGFGKGKAKWHDAFEVAQAAAYVAQWSEHLLDWTTVAAEMIEEKVRGTFAKARVRI
ncbi:MAG: hypothetical protein HY744_04160 [Deltaproteobacteria bacterium]|nr:hypothetical protein [Deltaproteobacteria bacterium]